MSKISELSDGGSLVSSDYLIAVRSNGNVKVRLTSLDIDEVNLEDNEFIRLGNSQDLTMVHNASNSIINQAGIGDLLLQKAGATKLTINATGIDVTGDIVLGDNNPTITMNDSSVTNLQHLITSSSDRLIIAADNNNVSAGSKIEFYVDGIKYSEVTPTGIDVTGSVTADGLTVDGNARIEEIGAIAKLTLERGGSANAADSAAVDLLETNAGSEGANFGDAATNGFRLKLDGSANDFLIQSGASGTVNTRFGIDRDSGDISFYDDAAAQGLFWDSSASRLGLGTTLPASALELSGAATANARLTLSQTTAGLSSQIQQGSTGLAISAVGSQPILLDTNGVEAMRIDASGNVGIGNASPIAALDVTGKDAAGSLTSLADTVTRAAAIVRGSTHGNGYGLYMGYGNTSTDAQYIQSTKANGATAFPLLLNPYGGNVGIGTSSPAALIHGMSGDLFLTANSTSADSGQGMFFQSTTNGWSTASAHAAIYGKRIDASNGYLRFDTRQSGTTQEAMRIDASGSVGIGTSSPDSKIHLNDGALHVQQTDGSDTWFGLGANNDNYITTGASGITVFRAVGTERMRIDASGRVGIGTDSPIAPLHVKGTTNGNLLVRAGSLAVGTLTGTALSSINDAASATVPLTLEGSEFNFVQSNAVKVKVDASGNLLVGKTTDAFGTAGIALRGTVADFIRSGGAAINTNLIGGSNGDTIVFHRSGVAVGSVSVSGTNATFNTSSDQRLKENIADADDAGSKIDAIQVRKFDWKVDGSHQDYGMIAQELLEVAPSAVSAPEDSDEMMGVDYSKLVPMMLKEIQSLRARIAALES